MALCLQCSSKNDLHSTAVGTAQWLKEQNRISAIPPNAPSPNNRPFHPKSSSVEVSMNIGGPDRNILFWGSGARPIQSSLPSAPVAYGKYKNMGIARVVKGVVRIKCEAPRPYTEHGRTWPPHLHYANPKSDTQWGSQVFTMAAFPGHHQQKKTMYNMRCINQETAKCSILTPSLVFKHWPKFCIVNALPDKSLGIVKPGSPYKAMHVPYNADQRQIEKAARAIGNRPYLVHCYTESCNAATELIRRFMNVKKGAKNVYYMPAGQQGWIKWLESRP